MSFQPATDKPPQLLVQLEIFPEHADEATLAMVSAVRRDTVDELQNTGYSVQAVPGGQRGADVLVNVITTLTNITTNVWANKEIFERVLTDVGGLVTVCGGIAPIAKTLLRVLQKRTATTHNVQEAIKITVEIDGAPVTVEAADLEQAEAALTLAQRFHSTHPTIAKSVTTRSKVKLKASVPRTQQRKRR
jgi:hypothetical protein